MSEIDFKGAIDAGIDALNESPEWLRSFEPAFAAISEYTGGTVTALYEQGVIVLIGPRGKYPVFHVIRHGESLVIIETTRVAYGSGDVTSPDGVSHRLMRLMTGRHFATVLQKARAI